MKADISSIALLYRFFLLLPLLLFLLFHFLLFLLLLLVLLLLFSLIFHILLSSLRLSVLTEKSSRIISWAREVDKHV